MVIGVENESVSVNAYWVYTTTINTIVFIVTSVLIMVLSVFLFFLCLVEAGSL